MKSLRIICDKKRSTIQWMKKTQLQLNLSPVKTKATQTWTCGCLLLECGTHSGVGVESASRGIEDRTASVVSITSRACRKLGRCQRTARRFTTVAVDFAQFASIFIQLSVLDDVDRLLRDDQAPCRRPTRQQVSGNLLFFSISASFSYRLDRSFTLVCVFVPKFRSLRAAIEVAEQPPNKCCRYSSFLGNRWKLARSFRCLSYLLQRTAQWKTVFRVAVQLGWPCPARYPLDRRALQEPWNRTINSEGRHEKWTCLTKISHMWSIQRVASPADVYLSWIFCAIDATDQHK